MGDSLTAHTMVLLLDAEINRGGHAPGRLRDLEQARTQWLERLAQARTFNEALAPFLGA